MGKYTYRTSKIKLHGFNNLTKSLNFNFYRICYTETPQQKEEFIQLMDEEYSANRLTDILCEVAEMIGANVLNIAKQDYEPQGASATLLIAEEPVQYAKNYEQQKPYHYPAYNEVAREAVVAHLDKSHIAVHTYPESHPRTPMSTFRADIDVSTCGLVSPLKALDFLLQTFGSDAAMIDYRVRGFTRDNVGKKHYLDHAISSIQDFLSQEVKDKYELADTNVVEENLFHTKLKIKELGLESHVPYSEYGRLTRQKGRSASTKLNKELTAIFGSK